MSSPTIEHYEDVEGRWRWRLLDADAHVLADGTEARPDRGSLEAAVERAVDAMATAPVEVVDRSLVVVEPGWVVRRFDASGAIAAEVGPFERYGAVEGALGGPAPPGSWRSVRPTGIAVRRRWFLCHRGHDGEWRWTLRAGGRARAESGEGYPDPGRARRMAVRTAEAATSATVRRWG